MHESNEVETAIAKLLDEAKVAKYAIGTTMASLGKVMDNPRLNAKFSRLVQKWLAVSP